jgi:putative membrane protein
MKTWMNLALSLAPALLAATPAAAPVMEPTDYVRTAGASDLYERTSSQVVLETTTDPKVRSFAQMMIAEHTASTADVKAAAAKAKVPSPGEPKLTPLQKELVSQLRLEQGPARDAAYIAQQRASHQQALNVQQAYAAEGTAPPLKAAAAKIVPVVQRHIEMLKTM